MRITKIGAVLAAFTAIASVLGSQITHAQHGQLSRIASTLSARGYATTHQTRTGWLREGESTTFSVWLSRGTDYSIRGTCDDDCPDLDLELTVDGRVVDSDYMDDDIPIVGVIPVQSDLYRVKVMMARCSREPCRYSAAVFGR